MCVFTDVPISLRFRVVQDNHRQKNPRNPFEHIQPTLRILLCTIKLVHTNDNNNNNIIIISIITGTIIGSTIGILCTKTRTPFFKFFFFTFKVHGSDSFVVLRVKTS